MTFGLMRRVAVVAALITALGVATTVAASAAGTSKPQQRQLAVSTLSNFKVVLTAIRKNEHSLMATVTAAGYQRSGSHWRLIGAQSVGSAGGWFWFSVDTCSLTVTQLKNTKTGNPPAATFDSAKVSLLVTPAIGCSPTFAAHFKP
jgi:hypothetical protein